MLPLVPTQLQPAGQLHAAQLADVLFDPGVAQHMLGQLDRRLKLTRAEDTVNADNGWLLLRLPLGAAVKKVNWDP